MDTAAAPAPPVALPAPSDGDDGAVMHLLHDHVPLALLADLAAPGGPTSREILDSEGLPAESWWRPVSEPA